MTIPFGATYCHSGPSWRNSQFFQVRPPSAETPQPLPTVPYQTSPCDPNAKAWTKSQEMELAVVSSECAMCSHALAPGRSTKIPCP